MSFGISGSDPFKSYASNSEAGGSMGVYVKRRKKDDGKKEQSKNEELLETDSDDEDFDVEIDDDFLL